MVQVLLFAFPWPIRVRLLRAVFGFRISDSARIGFALIGARQVELGSEAKVGHLTVIRGLDRLALADYAQIGPLNWIFAIPPEMGFFSDTPRMAELLMGRAASLTRRHLVDCSASVTIGAFALVAGYRSQILTHSVRLSRGRQDVRSIEIGEYAFVGTGCILLGGCCLPHHAALTAGSTLRDRFSEPYRVYAGVVAEDIGGISQDAHFFRRATTETAEPGTR